MRVVCDNGLEILTSIRVTEIAMGWFTCYGSVNKLKKPIQDPASSQESRSKASATHHAKIQPDNVKLPSSVDSNKDALKDAPVNVPAESIPLQSAPVPSISAQTFAFRELAAAAKNFSSDCLIGEGGFGPVYRGRLENDQVVAIKQLDRNGLQGNREFLVEVLMLSLLHHENLVNLIGYCADGDQRLLVYEFMPLGSLEDHLHDLPPDKEALDWNSRMKIAAGAAKGLEYLHDTANPPVIYRDLKSSNILLGEGFYPKLSDFGLAKLGPVGDKTHVSTRVMGTYGYCAPEYAMTGQLTLKSDVYSFGVVLLELITGRRAIDQSRAPGEHNLVAWARPLFKDRRKFPQMADPKLQGHFPVRGLFQALAVAAMCLHEQAATRPFIADVVTALNFLASQTCDPVVHPPKSTLSAPSFPVPDKKEKGKTGNASLADESVQQINTCLADDLHIKMEGATVQDNADDQKGTEVPKSSSRQSGWRAPMQGKEREQAIAEARSWGETWREKRGGSRVERDALHETSS